MSDQICFSFDEELGPAVPAVIAIVQVITTLIFHFVPKEKTKKIYKLLCVYLLTILLGTPAINASTHDWISAFFKANLLAYAQVFGHQVYKNIGR